MNQKVKKNGTTKSRSAVRLDLKKVLIRYSVKMLECAATLKIGLSEKKTLRVQSTTLFQAKYRRIFFWLRDNSSVQGNLKARSSLGFIRARDICFETARFRADFVHQSF